MKIPNFDDIKVSTITAIVNTNLEIDLEEAFCKLPVVDVDVSTDLKKRAQIESFILSQNYQPGSILNIEYKGNMRGFKIKKRKQWDTASRTRPFRNAASIVLITKSKRFATIKIPHRGKFQITGCQSIEQAQECVQHVWQNLKNLPNVCKIMGENLHVITRAVMTNIDFKLDTKINLQELDDCINGDARINSAFYSLYEPSLTYPGANIKQKYTLENIDLDTMTFVNGKWEYGSVKYNTYLSTLNKKEQKHELTKQRKNTFLVFMSGSIIMSGMCRYYMRKTYYEFMNILQKFTNKPCTHMLDGGI